MLNCQQQVIGRLWFPWPFQFLDISIKSFRVAPLFHMILKLGYLKRHLTY